jgi:hypothetical protein
MEAVSTFLLEHQTCNKYHPFLASSLEMMSGSSDAISNVNQGSQRKQSCHTAHVDDTLWVCTAPNLGGSTQWSRASKTDSKPHLDLLQQTRERTEWLKGNSLGTFYLPINESMLLHKLTRNGK